MIIELFGPPASGKTTFARALAAQLQQRGYAADLVLSCRPAENSSSPDTCAPGSVRQVAAAMRRLSRPIAEMLAHPSCTEDINIAASMIRIMPPRNVIWLLKTSQYVVRLSRSWRLACRTNHIVIFDQAFVQTVCSLMLLGRAPDEAAAARALDSAPKSDMLIQLEAPRDILEARLHNRERFQGAVQQLFELDLQRNLQSIAIIQCLQDLLQRRGRPVVRLRSLDEGSLCEAVERIEERITTAIAAERVEKSCEVQRAVHDTAPDQIVAHTQGTDSHRNCHA